MRESLYGFCTRTGREELLCQWEETRNNPLTPQSVTYGSHERVWWRCEKGHCWQTTVYTRTINQSGCPYCAGKRAVPGETDLETCYPHLAAQWHPTRNAPLSPEQVLPGSHRMIWWRCEKGHEWKASVKARTEGCGCPVCANRVVDADNSLAACYPALAAQWHPTKNGALTPEQIAPGSDRKIWWQCPLGHVWQAVVNSRTGSGKGCPYCAGKAVLPNENDLATAFPALAAQWHPSKNLPLTPSAVTPYSNRKVWWICQEGHTYSARIGARATSKSECPYCTNRKVLAGFNDLATAVPEVAAQWHPTLNGTLTPQMVTAGSRKKVWWQCPLGHVWKAVIYSRASAQRNGCPVCAGVVRRKPPLRPGHD